MSLSCVDVLSSKLRFMTSHITFQLTKVLPIRITIADEMSKENNLELAFHVSNIKLFDSFMAFYSKNKALTFCLSIFELEVINERLLKL